MTEPTDAEVIRHLAHLHVPDDTGKACDGCGTTWPCRTVRALWGIWGEPA